MNQLPTSDNPVTMSTREIAALTGKQHKDVIRDVRVMREALAKDGADLRHLLEHKDARGYTAEFLLDRPLTETLLTGYSIPLRHRVILRLAELEQRTAPPSIPRTLPEALRLAADLAEQNNRLQVAVSEQAPKVEALARIAEAGGSMCLTDAAKHLGVQRCRLIEWMRANRWIYRREGSMRLLAYQPRLAAGLLDHKVSIIGREDDGAERLASQVRVTAKGLALLAQKMGAPRSAAHENVARNEGSQHGR
ncbi:phage antirepressor KilAC domain-containing protein [Pseudomonas sp. SP16.1]|uniref:phage antirepressor KilAC domain-containing protein n=1 Tax=Pseudomonas sp. SP16.1 TaxID=3458854 RepID=UPI004045483C